MRKFVCMAAVAVMFVAGCKNEEPKKALDELGLERYCCRALFLGHIDLLEKVSQFKKF